ncbi:MAG TPA: spore coat U domain-containing protein [Variovorax sp.]|nr:spore coat U domain-containing protein [Variovorax sp.]
MTSPLRPPSPFARRARLAVLAPACAGGIVAGAWLTAGNASAATQTAVVGINTSIPTTCTVTALSNMAFSAAITSTAAQTHDAQGGFRVNCTNAGIYGVSIPVSGNGTGTQRRMFGSGTGGYLRYDVYASAADRTAAGPLYPTAPTATGQAGNGNDQDFVLYGRIPVQTAPAPGSYTDTLTVTVGY